MPETTTHLTSGKVREIYDLDDERLLGILGAEESDVGLDHVEELGDDSRDAVEVLRAAVLAFERLDQRAGKLHARGEARRVRR